MTASPEVGPDAGQPVSVTQTGLPVETATVWSYALKKRSGAEPMSFCWVFWKYGYASMPRKSTASTTAELEPLIQAVKVST